MKIFFITYLFFFLTCLFHCFIMPVIPHRIQSDTLSIGTNYLGPAVKMAQCQLNSNQSELSMQNTEHRKIHTQLHASTHAPWQAAMDEIDYSCTVEEMAFIYRGWWLPLEEFPWCMTSLDSLSSQRSSRFLFSSIVVRNLVRSNSCHRNEPCSLSHGFLLCLKQSVPLLERKIPSVFFLHTEISLLGI